MNPSQQTEACMSELPQMILEAIRDVQWLPLNNDTLIVQGFNTLVGRKEAGSNEV